MKTPVKKFFFLYLFLLSVLYFQSCKMNYSSEDYTEDSIAYLQENYGGSYSFSGIKKSKNQAIVFLKAEDLNNKTVAVKFDITEHKAFSISYKISTNYIPIKFQEAEEEYYRSKFAGNFADCLCTIDNTNRFLSDYPSAANNKDSYLSYLAHEALLFDDFIKVIASQPQSSYLTWEDRLKATLIDIENKIDGYFYLVDAVNFSYEDNYIHKASIKAVSGQYEKSSYEVIK